MADDENDLGPFVAASFQAIEALASIIYEIAPDELEAKLRAARLLVQETDLGRHESHGGDSDKARRLYRDLLERAVANGRDSRETN